MQTRDHARSSPGRLVDELACSRRQFGGACLAKRSYVLIDCAAGNGNARSSIAIDEGIAEMRPARIKPPHRNGFLKFGVTQRSNSIFVPSACR
jgi:hypothetical protein